MPAYSGEPGATGSGSPVVSTTERGQVAESLSLNRSRTEQMRQGQWYTCYGPGFASSVHSRSYGFWMFSFIGRACQVSGVAEPSAFLLTSIATALASSELMLVHHARKTGAPDGQAGKSLTGSGDLWAWFDSEQLRARLSVKNERPRWAEEQGKISTTHSTYPSPVGRAKSPCRVRSTGMVGAGSKTSPESGRISVPLWTPEEVDGGSNRL